MSEIKNKIAYSPIGGIFIAKNIDSNMHKHHTMALVFSFDVDFQIVDNKENIYEFAAVLIPKDISYKLLTKENSVTAFIHLDPYSEMALKLNRLNNKFIKLNRADFLSQIDELKSWFYSEEDSNEKVIELLRSILSVLVESSAYSREIDERILESIRYIDAFDVENLLLEEVAKHVALSKSRLYHLFKEETGITFKQYLQHRKLVKSLHAIQGSKNFTEASYSGGFADQSHFNKTFKNNFGIKPSEIKK